MHGVTTKTVTSICPNWIRKTKDIKLLALSCSHIRSNGFCAPIFSGNFENRCLETKKEEEVPVNAQYDPFNRNCWEQRVFKTLDIIPLSSFWPSKKMWWPTTAVKAAGHIKKTCPWISLVTFVCWKRRDIMIIRRECDFLLPYFPWFLSFLCQL